jgi:hypothetical protein
MEKLKKKSLVIECANRIGSLISPTNKQHVTIKKKCNRLVKVLFSWRSLPKKREVDEREG